MSEAVAAAGEAVEAGDGPKPVRIGLLGKGNVGAAFAELLAERTEAQEAKAAAEEMFEEGAGPKPEGEAEAEEA